MKHIYWNLETKLQTFFCFPNLRVSDMGDWAPFAFYVSYFWNASRTCAPSWFLVSDAYTPCCILLHDIFYVFGRDLSWRKRDWLQHFQVKLFSCARRVSVEEWISVYSIFHQSTFETTLLLDAVFIGFLWHKWSERTTWLWKHQLLVHCHRKFHLYFHSYTGANIWKTTRIVVSRLENNTNCCESSGKQQHELLWIVWKTIMSEKQHELLWICSWPRKPKYFRIAVKLACDVFSEKTRIP